MFKFSEHKKELGALILVVLAFLIAVISIKILKIEDAPIEEACEQLIEHYTGYDVDISPGSKELF